MVLPRILAAGESSLILFMFTWFFLAKQRMMSHMTYRQHPLLSQVDVISRMPHPSGKPASRQVVPRREMM